MTKNQPIKRRRILLGEDVSFSGASLSQILDQSKCELIKCDVRESLDQFITDLEFPPDLLIVSIDYSKPSMLEEIREARASLRGRQIPILGVTTFTEHVLDIAVLRAHGVVGLIDRKTDHRMITRRVDMILERPERNRLCERAPCFLPVEIAEATSPNREYALDLSASGIRLTTKDSLDLNTNLQFWFRLPMVTNDRIKVDGRIVRKLPKRNSAALYEVGVFFYPMALRSRNTIAREVERLLRD